MFTAVDGLVKFLVEEVLLLYSVSRQRYTGVLAGIDVDLLTRQQYCLCTRQVTVSKVSEY